MQGWVGSKGLWVCALHCPRDNGQGMDMGEKDYDKSRLGVRNPASFSSLLAHVEQRSREHIPACLCPAQCRRELSTRAAGSWHQSPAGASRRSPHLLQLAVDVLHDQVDGHRVPTTCSASRMRDPG